MAESTILNIDFGDTLQRLAEIKNATKDLKTENDALKKSIEESGQATEEQTKQIVKNEAELRDLNREQKVYQKAIDDNVKLQKAQKGSIEANRAELSKLTSEYIRLSKPTAEQTARIKALSDTLKAQESALGDNRRSVGGYAQAIAQSIPGLNGVITGVKGFNTQLKANPIGAVVGLLIQLAQYLQSNAKVADFLSAAFAGINKIFSTVIDTVVTTVSSLDNLTQALAHPIDFIFNLGKNMVQAGKEGYEAAKQLDAFTKASHALDNEIKKNEQTIKAQTFALKDRTKTEKERIAIAEDIAALEVKNADLAAERAQKELDAEQLKLKGKQLTADEEARLGDLKTAVEIANSDKIIAQNQKQTRINILLDKQEQESSKALATEKKNQDKTQEEIEADAAKEKAKTLQQRLSDSKIYFDQQALIEKENLLNGLISQQEYEDRLKQLKVDSLTDQLDILQTSGQDIQAKEIELQNAMLDNEIAFHKAQNENDKQAAADALKINQQQVEDFKAQQDAKLGIAQATESALTSLLTIFGQQSAEAQAFSKLLAIAQIGIDTARSISAGIAGATTSATATGPGAFIATPIFIATTIATILGAVAQATTILKKSSPPNPPKFAEGGRVVDIGGRSHAQGGTEISLDGVPVATAEKDEKMFILKKTASEYIDRFSMLNKMFGGKSWNGNPVRHAALGGNIASSFDGGLAAREALNRVTDRANIDTRPIQVSVTEINKVQKSVAKSVDVSQL